MVAVAAGENIGTERALLRTVRKALDVLARAVHACHGLVHRDAASDGASRRSLGKRAVAGEGVGVRGGRATLVPGTGTGRASTHTVTTLVTTAVTTAVRTLSVTRYTLAGIGQVGLDLGACTVVVGVVVQRVPVLARLPQSSVHQLPHPTLEFGRPRTERNKSVRPRKVAITDTPRVQRHAMHAQPEDLRIRMPARIKSCHSDGASSPSVSRIPRFSPAVTAWRPASARNRVEVRHA